MKHILSIIFISISFFAYGQYNIKPVVKLECTSIKSQDRTGTCWSFATASFLESEVIRMGKGVVDLSEMFVVQNVYSDKAKNYLYRQGKANFSQGSLSHDLIKVLDKNGVMPESIYSGKLEGDLVHDHGEMESGLKGFLDGLVKMDKLSSRWSIAFDAIMSSYLGSYPREFTYEGKSYTPKSYAKSLGLDASNYLSITSFTHHPFYSNFVLEIPDNYSNGSYFNVRLNEMVEIVDVALDAGFTIAWDGDVSEDGFSARKGLAILPVKDIKDPFDKPGKEITVTQENRQSHFEDLSTTDDHLMQIIGTGKDQNGGKYYIIKNSWGEIGPENGFIYMSEAYFKMKTIAILLNKSALPKSISKKIKAL